MHEEFCIVSDFPEILTKDEQNRPHNKYGPSHRWRDGFEIYHLDGVRLPKELWEKITSKKLTAADLANITDIDQRVVAQKYGLSIKDFIESLDATLLNEGANRHYLRDIKQRTIKRLMVKEDLELANVTIHNKLYKTDFFKGQGTKYFLVYNDPSTDDQYFSFCTQGVEKYGEDADAVMGWKHHMTKKEYLSLEREA